MANVELGSSNLKEVYDAINANSGSSIDTTNLAKLNEANTFTAYQTFQQPINVMSNANLNGEVGISGNFYIYSDTIEIGKATTGGLNIQTADNSVTMNLADTCDLTVENRLKTELQRELEINPVDTSSFAQLTSNNTFTGVQTFNSNVSINGTLDVGDVNLRGNTTFYSNSIFKNPLVVANNTANQELAIIPILNGVSINLGDDCTLTMNTKMISELKRLLGIQ